MRVLIVDDDPLSREVVKKTVQGVGHECLVAGDAEEAWEIFLRSAVDVVISDLLAPDAGGLELCRRVRRFVKQTYTYFILLTAVGQEPDLNESMEAGIDDCLSRPPDPDKLATRLFVASRIVRLRQNAMLSGMLASEKTSALEEVTRAGDSSQNMVGKSGFMQEVYRRIRLASQSQVTVLLYGESGTGKELAAQAIHSRSVRAERPLITINCGALPDSTLESELFGHVRGAFTGAVNDKLGLFQLADQGTLLLDEVGDLSPRLQSKLLRVIQEREIRPVGGERSIKVDVRIIAATNKDLRELVRKGEFREDLYYRVRVFQIDLPSLRDCREDIPLLVDHYLKKLSHEHGKKVEGVDPVAFQLLMNYSWPGNVRELRNAIEHGIVVVSDDRIRADDLPEELRSQFVANEGERKSAADGAAKSIEILETLRACNGSRTEAAKRLGISRVALWKRVRRLGIASQLPPPPGRSTKRRPPAEPVGSADPTGRPPRAFRRAKERRELA